MVSSIGMFFLVTSSIIAILPFIFSNIMAYSFYRKRTMGTLYMALSFTLITFAEILNSLSNWFGVLASNPNIALWLQSLFINLYGIGIIYFYLFSTRNILKDNEVMRSMYAIVLTELATAITVLLLIHISGGNIGFNAVRVFQLAGSEIPFITPSLLILLIFFVPLHVIVLYRVMFQLLFFTQKITDPVAKKGTQFIHLSTIWLSITVTLVVLMQIPPISTHPGAMIFLQIVKIITMSGLLITGYIGWTLPDWFKKRIRGKAWIVQAFKKTEGKEITYAYSSSKDVRATNVPIRGENDP